LDFFLWASLVVLVYTLCVLRGSLRFFNKTVLTYQKKKNSIHAKPGFLSNYATLYTI
jgi:hypothetical protein